MDEPQSNGVSSRAGRCLLLLALTMFILLLGLSLGDHASESAEAQNLSIFFHPDDWTVFATRDNVTYQVGENVTCQLHVYYGGIPTDLTNLTVRVILNETYAPSIEVNSTPLSTGLYQVYFILEERMVRYSHYVTAYQYVETRGFQLFITSYEYDSIENQYTYNRGALQLALDHGYEEVEVSEPRVIINMYLPTTINKVDELVYIEVKGLMGDLPTEVDDVVLKVDGENISVEKRGPGFYLGRYRIPEFDDCQHEFRVLASMEFQEVDGRPILSLNQTFTFSNCQVWSRWVKVEKDEAVIEVGIADDLAHPLAGVEVKVIYSYHSNKQSNVEHEVRGRTGSDGLARLVLRYDDIDHGHFNWKVEVILDEEITFTGRSVELPEEETEPYHHLQIDYSVSGYPVFFSLYDEPFSRTFQLTRNGGEFPAGSRIEVLVASPFRVLHEQTYLTNEKGEITVEFTITPPSDPEFDETGNTLSAFYYNNSQEIEAVESYITLMDEDPGYYTENWSQISFLGTKGSLVLGGITKLNITIPENLTLENGPWSSNAINFVTIDGWHPHSGLYYWEMNPYLEYQEVEMALPAFLDSENIILDGYLYLEDEDGLHWVNFGYNYTTQRAEDPAGTIWYNPQEEEDQSMTTEESLALLLLLVVVTFTVSTFIAGRSREREEEAQRAARREAMEAQERERNRKQAADPDHWKPRQPTSPPPDLTQAGPKPK